MSSFHRVVFDGDAMILAAGPNVSAAYQLRAFVYLDYLVPLALRAVIG
jgi:hypothetical protein